MSNLENSIKDCITKELEKGIIEKVITENLEKCIKESLKDMFGWNGDIKKTIEEKIKSVMTPYLEEYDYSKYIVKLDSVLIDILKSTTLENKQMLENFKELMGSESNVKEIKLSDIFKKWTEYCKENIDKDKLDIDYEGTYINTSFFAEEISESWSGYRRYMITFECEEDEDLKFQFCISNRKETDNNKYSSDFSKPCDLRSLRHINKFELLLLKISEGYRNIILDKERDSQETFIEYEE